MTMTVCCSDRCIPLLIQQNVDGSDFFNRTWDEFKIGFNNSGGNYWIGNDRFSQLTRDRRYRLRFDLQLSYNSSWYWAEYSTFVVADQSRNYQLQVHGYSGNAGDTLDYHNGMMFTTYDRDNDLRTDDNCAVREGGGFWHKRCSWCSVNGVRDPGNYFRWNAHPQPGNLILRTSRMWLTC